MKKQTKTPATKKPVPSMKYGGMKKGSGKKC